MPTLTIRLQADARVPESTTNYITNGAYTDEVLYAYTQEYNLDAGETPLAIDIADDPNYSDFVFIRIEAYEWWTNVANQKVFITANSGSGTFRWTLSQATPFIDIFGVDIWTDDSAGGSADTIDDLELAMGAYRAKIRITAFTVAS